MVTRVTDRVERARRLYSPHNRREFSDKYNGMPVKIRDLSAKCCGAYIHKMITGEWDGEAFVTFDIEPFCDILNFTGKKSIVNVYATMCSTDIENITCPGCLKYMDSLDFVERKIEEQFNGR